MFELGNPLRYTDSEGHFVVPTVVIAGAIVFAQYGSTSIKYVYNLGYFTMSMYNKDYNTAVDIKERADKNAHSMLLDVMPYQNPLTGWTDIPELTEDFFETIGEVWQANHVTNTQPTVTIETLQNRENSNSVIYINNGGGSSSIWKYNTIDGVPLIDSSVPIGTDVGNGWKVSEHSSSSKKSSGSSTKDTDGAPSGYYWKKRIGNGGILRKID